MKILPAVVLFLLSIFSGEVSFGQENTLQNQAVLDFQMQDTTIILDHSFLVRNIYATKDSLAAVKKTLARKAVMQDTIIVIDPSFVVLNVYTAKDSLTSMRPRLLTKRDSLIRAIKDSFSALGNALIRSAEMQDTIIALNPSFIVRDIYAKKDRFDAVRDSIRASLARSAQMQDTTIIMDPSFIINKIYAKKDRFDAVRDSIRASLARSAQMQDTTIIMDPSFIVRNVYAGRDASDAVRDSFARPGFMQDTVIVLDTSFIIRGLYLIKDSLDALRDSLTAITDSLYNDSVSRHWAGWKNYEIQPGHSYTLNSQKVLKGKSRSDLQYNIADFYLYLNGEPVRPSKSAYDFFTAGCLAFKYDDTLLLNSGLGFKVGVGVGIKIFKEKFTSSLHANTRNKEVYKLTRNGSTYMKSIIVEPLVQSLKLRSYPAYASHDVIIGEYQASYKKFFQKNEDGQDEVRRYTVRIVFRCRVTGGIDSIKSMNGAGSK